MKYNYNKHRTVNNNTFFPEWNDNDDFWERKKKEINPHLKPNECTCTSKDLFNYGCRCGFLKPYDPDKIYDK